MDTMMVESRENETEADSVFPSVRGHPVVDDFRKGA